METRTAAVKSITSALETEVGRKIIASRMVTLSEDNRILKRKVAEDRIAVHALNELTRRLVDLIHSIKAHMDQNGYASDERTTMLVKSVQLYQGEAFGQEMVARIGNILGDTTGDDLLLEDLIGKQPKEEGK